MSFKGRKNQLMNLTKEELIDTIQDYEIIFNSLDDISLDWLKNLETFIRVYDSQNSFTEGYLVKLEFDVKTVCIHTETEDKPYNKNIIIREKSLYKIPFNRIHHWLFVEEKKEIPLEE